MNSSLPNPNGLAKRILTAWAAAVLAAVPASAQPPPVELVAHRGGFLQFPENTCISFQSCSGLVDQIEFDVRATADGELVLMHDETVNRTTTGYGPVTNVDQLTLAELQALDAGAKFSPAYAGERVPTLAEAVRALPPGMQGMLHRKTGSAAAIVNVLRAENALSNITVCCDFYEFLLQVRQLEPALKICAIGTGSPTTNSLAWFQRMGIPNVSWEKKDLNPETVQRIHSYGLRLYAWSISDPEIDTFVDYGVDGLIVDHPANASAWVRAAPPANEQLSRSLVAYWKLDNGLLDLATTVADDVETNSPGQLSGFAGPPAWLPPEESRAGGALRFDGLAARVLIPANPALTIGTNAVTLSAWVKLDQPPSALSNSYACIYGSDKDGYVFYLDRAARELRFKVTDAQLQTARPGIPEALLQTGVWHHVVGVYNGAAGVSAGQAMIYLDGRIRDIHTGSDDLAGTGLKANVRSQRAAIGAKGSLAGSNFAGAVDDLAIWRRALEPAEIKSIYQAGTNGMPLEKITMTIWIENVYPDLETGEMQMDIRVEHGTLTPNQALRLRGAVLSTDPYTDQAELAGGRGHRANYRVPHSAFGGPHRNDTSSPELPNFFQVVAP